MKNKIRIIFILAFILSTANLFSQGLTVSTPSLNFGAAYENIPDSLPLTIFNSTGRAVTVTGIKFYDTYNLPAFSAAYHWFSIPDGSSQITWIKFSPIHNIFHNSELVIENDGLLGYVSVDLTGQGKYSNTYYDQTENKSEEALKSAIHDITGVGYDTLLYGPARDEMFMVIDNQMVNGQGADSNTIESIYTDTFAVGYIDRVDCQTRFSFNTEHTFPQSLFTSLEPMKSDLHHLFPTDDISNNVRGNNPFGVVTNPTWTSVGGSKSNGTTFEPRDLFKGPIARAMFYFTLRYQNYNNFLTNQESILRTWNAQFPPNLVERNRNDDINSVQHNRNPFVDYPQLLDRITSVSLLSTTLPQPSIDLTQDTIIYGFIPSSTPVLFHYVIVNDGNTDVHFTGFSLTNSSIFNFQSGGIDTTIAAGDALGIDISCTTPNTDSVHALLIFSTDAPGYDQVSIPIFVNDPVITNIPKFTEQTISVYPNPTGNFVTIRFSDSHDKILKLFDLSGRQINFLEIESGSQQSTIDLKSYQPGMYLLEIDNKISGKKVFEKILKY